MNSNDFVKYLTVQIVERIDSPRKKKSETLTKKRNTYYSHWFGLIPLSLKIMVKRFQKNK